MPAYTSLKRKFIRALRTFAPRVRDTLVVATLDNAQSLVMLKLLLEVEQEYDTNVHHVHLSNVVPNEVREILANSRIVTSSVVAAPVRNYTEVKTILLPYVETHPGALFVLPFTADDLACYFLEEILRGNLVGLRLEARARVAYPLYTTTLREVSAVRPGGLPAKLLGECALLSELEDRVAPQAVGTFYVEIYVKNKKLLERA